MRIIEFDRDQEVPIVSVLIKGPRSVKRANLIFDTGSGITQIHTALIEAIGYSARDGQRRFRVKGAVGEPQEGYILSIESLSLFGSRYVNIRIGAIDFNDLVGEYQIDGLLGFDLIKQLHIEVNGPAGTLIVHD